MITTAFGFLILPLNAQFVYVLADTPQELICRIWAYEVGSTGSLTSVPGSPFAAGFSFSGALAVDPKDSYLVHGRH